jgi:hypothetical protein
MGVGQPPQYSTRVASAIPDRKSRVAEATPWPLGGGSATPKGQKEFKVFFFLKKKVWPLGWICHPRLAIGHPQGLDPFFFLKKLLIHFGP